jgi:hypothetical protein
MFIVSPTTICNAQALDTRRVPKRMIGRISLIPRRGASWKVVARLIFEVQVLRYLAALAPFVIAMLLWPHLALPISQAPIPMLLVIALVETKVFNMPKDKREKLISEDDMARALDALRFNARRILTRIAARRDMKAGELLLVVEQSEISRVPPLTLVSVQQAEPEPMVLDLDARDRALIEAELFDDRLTPSVLHHVGLRQRQNLHSVSLDAREISAHARIAALVSARPGSIAAQEVKP